MANTINVSKSLNVTVAQDFIQSVQGESAYYVFAAKHTPYFNNSDAVIPTPVDSVQGNVRDIYNDMLFGKRINPTDIVPLVERFDYISNRLYAQYDDTAASYTPLFNFVGVQEGDDYRVYKCLYNNGGANSTIEPYGTDINPIELSDDYIWKYMYTANSFMMDKFATDFYVPLTPNNVVVANATPGAIEVINIQDGGVGYDNYFEGEIDTIKVNGNPLRYAINPTASNTENFYNNCLIKMTAGDGNDEYRVITDYYISGGKKVIVLNQAWSGNVAATDTFEIYPYVEVYDTGGLKQTNCIARALISANTGNSVYKVEVLDAGSGYRSANVVIRPDATVAVASNAVLRAIISPPGGHGSNQAAELNAVYAGITTRFIQDEEALNIENDYRQVGILKDPLFANLVIRINQSNTVGAFEVGENIYQYRDMKLAGNVAVTNGSATVTGTGTFFQDSLANNDFVLITNGDQNIFTKVAAIASNTSLTLTTNATFTGSGATISFVNAISYGVMVGNAAGEITVSGISTAGLSSSLRLVGGESYCTSVVNVAAVLPVSIHGRNPNGFNTFTQLTRFVGTLTSGSFIEDELVVQETSQGAALSYAQPKARYHSGNSTTMFVTNANNIFEIGEVITGANSDATFTVSAKYEGEIEKDSGQIVYVENLSPISRSDTQTETVKLILEF
jgi:hypothetical protein